MGKGKKKTTRGKQKKNSSVSECPNSDNQSKNPEREGFKRNKAKFYKDNNGRTIKGVAVFRDVMSKEERPPAEKMAQRKAGGNSRMATDQGGHIFGFRFMDAQGDINLFPQDGNFNMGAYKTLENEIANWVEMGMEVTLKVDFKPPGAERPDKVLVRYNVTDPATGKTRHTRAKVFYNKKNQVFNRVKKKKMKNHQR